MWSTSLTLTSHLINVTTRERPFDCPLTLVSLTNIGVSSGPGPVGLASDPRPSSGVCLPAGVTALPPSRVQNNGTSRCLLQRHHCPLRRLYGVARQVQIAVSTFRRHKVAAWRGMSRSLRSTTTSFTSVPQSLVSLPRRVGRQQDLHTTYLQRLHQEATCGSQPRCTQHHPVSV